MSRRKKDTQAAEEYAGVRVFTIRLHDSIRGILEAAAIKEGYTHRDGSAKLGTWMMACCLRSAYKTLGEKVKRELLSVEREKAVAKASAALSKYGLEYPLD